jgi:predicted MFS family arabinose efflux permease
MMGKAGSALGAFVVFGVLAWAMQGLGVVPNDTYSTIFFIGIIPSAIAFIVLFLFVKDAPKKVIQAPALFFRFKDIFKLGKQFWLFMILVCVFNFSHFSETFLQLRAREVGVLVSFAPLVMVVMNLAIALVAYPIGRLSDYFGRRIFLTVGFLFVIIADLFLAFGEGYVVVFMAITCWGVQMAMTQGMIATIVIDVADPNHRGSAFGVLNLVMGLVYLIASPLYGWIWDTYGGGWPFICSALVTLASICILYITTQETKHEKT